MQRQLLLLLFVFASALPAHAGYAADATAPVWIRAVLDVRLVRGRTTPSWTDLGPGKTRYGGPRTQFVLSQFDIELGAALPLGLTARAQMNLQTDLDSSEPWLVEALLRKEWGADARGWGMQAGLLTNPFSLEHKGPAWSPAYSITPAALSSWLWEEISLAGIEAEHWQVTKSGLRLGALVGTGFGPDQLGRLVALRGWAMGDTLSGLNASLPLPSGRRVDVFDERDHRPAVYGLLSVENPSASAALRLGYFNNLGDQAIAGVWSTHFTTLGVTVHAAPRLDLVAQYLRGEAYVHNLSNDSSLSAYYGLISYHSLRQRLTLRYDSFRVRDTDGGNPTAEHGTAWTADYSVQWGLRHRVGVEYIWLESERAAFTGILPTQDGWQLNYRFRY